MREYIVWPNERSKHGIDMKHFVRYLPALLLFVGITHAGELVTPEWTQARNLYDWMQNMRPLINKAGMAGKTDDLKKLRGMVMARMGAVHYGKDNDPYQSCGLALYYMHGFLTTAIDKKPKKDRDTLAAVFRQDLADCKRSIR